MQFQVCVQIPLVVAFVLLRGSNSRGIAPSGFGGVTMTVYSPFLLQLTSRMMYVVGIPSILSCIDLVTVGDAVLLIVRNGLSVFSSILRYMCQVNIKSSLRICLWSRTQSHEIVTY